MKSRFPQKTKKMIQLAADISKGYSAENLDLIHLILAYKKMHTIDNGLKSILAISEDDILNRYFNSVEKSKNSGTEFELTPISVRAEKSLKVSFLESKAIGTDEIFPELVILAGINYYRNYFSNYNLHYDSVKNETLKLVEKRRHIINQEVVIEKKSPKKIFISYRRQDSAAVAGRLYDFLENNLGQENLFKDVDSIPYGKDFKKEIQKAIDHSAIILVIIGQNFTTPERRLFSDNDLVRHEIFYSLQNNKVVIPVFVNDATMPPSDNLPDDIKEIASINGPELRNSKWKIDCEDFLKKIKVILNSSN